MKKAKRLLALVTALLLCVGIFAGCGTTTTTLDDDDNDTILGDLSENGSNITLTDVAEDIIGEVTYVSTSYLSVSIYESEGVITDYATLDTDTLTETGLTEYVYPEEASAYYTVSDGALVSAAADDLVTGCLIAVTTDAYGSQQIIILKGVGDDSAVSADDADTHDETAVTVAAVTAINDDGTVELTIYDAVDDALEITDYSAVDWDNYAASEITETFTIADDAVISVVEEGVLTETTSEEIIVGDMLVIYFDDDGVTNVAVYHSEEAST